MTDPAPPAVQPVSEWRRGWLLKRNDDVWLHVFASERAAKGSARVLDKNNPYRAPHRVIRVEIREVKDGE